MNNMLINIIVLSILFLIYLVSVILLNKYKIKKDNKNINFFQNLLLLNPLKHNIFIIISNIVVLILTPLSLVLSILNLNNLFDSDIYITLINSIIILLALTNLMFIVKKDLE